MVVNEIYEDIRHRFGKKYVVRVHNYESDPETMPSSDITVSMANDKRYALAQFQLPDNMILKCEIVFFTQHYQFEEEFKADLVDPTSLPKLTNWFVEEITDGLKRGWSGREKQTA